MTSFAASTKRPLQLRARRDLRAVAVESSGTQTWVLKDPLTLEHFHLSAEEYFLWQKLKRPASLEQLQQAFQRQFAPQTISPEALWSFVNRLFASGLLLSESTGQGGELLAEHDRQQSSRRLRSWTQLLAIRFRGIDPDRWLTRLHDRLSWLFSPAALAVLVVLVVYAASLVIGHFDEFLSRLPNLSALLDMRNVVWMMLAIGAVKVLHELGHALACKHYGGEVHELGLMLLAFTPCLYCDVSDVWKLPNHWQRIAVSAAGMIVELAIAALATIVWWHTQPGLIHLAALNVMIVCSVSTLLVNGNPLLRYDGYYILSDLTDTPNLWARSREALHGAWSRFVMGLRQFDDPLISPGKRIWLAAYALASKVYLFIVLVSIVWLLVQFLRPYHLENLGYGVGLVALCASLLPLAMSGTQLVRNPQRRAEVNGRRFLSVTAILAVGCIVLLAWPVTYHVRAPAVLLPEDATHVYTTVGGRLMSMAPADDHVEPGVTLASFENSEIHRDVTRLEGELNLQELRLTHLQRLRGLDSTANDQIPAAQAAVADLARQLEDRRRDAERLTVVAPAAGRVIAPPRIPSQANDESELETWSGSLLDSENQQAWVEPGTLLCLLGNPRRLSAVVLVDDADVERVAAGQSVRLCLEGLPDEIVEGEVVEVARGNPSSERQADAVASQLERLFADVTPAGSPSMHYQVTVRLNEVDLPLVTGSRGEAKIATERITMGRRILRAILRVFRAPL